MRMRMMLAGAVAAFVATTTTACGAGDDGSHGDDASPPPTLDPNAAAVAWTKCMREHGVDIPDPKNEGDAGGEVVPNVGAGGAPGTDPETFNEAKEACKKYADQMGGMAEDGELTEEDKQRMLQFAECMRENGVDMPDPDLDGSDGEEGITLPDTSDSNFQAAQEKCREFLPEGL